jgi:hypothetical protein
MKTASRDYKIEILSNIWNESYAETKRSLEHLSDKEVGYLLREVEGEQPF